jgi:hypothetical protein
MQPDTSKPVRTRLLSLVGLLVTAATIYLGGVWPSLYTLIAVPILPAPFIFATAIVRPAVLLKSPKLRVYLLVCVCVSVVTLIGDQIWLRFHAK